MADTNETTAGEPDIPATVAAASAALAALAAQEAEWQGKRATLRATLAEREQGVAAAALAGTATAKPSAELGRLRDEITLADGALALLAERHGPAAYAQRLAEQRDRRARYAQLEAEADRVWEGVVELWGPIGALTGATAADCRDRFPALENLERRREALRVEINYRDDFLRPGDQGGSV